jgi:hypothetical protein
MEVQDVEKGEEKKEEEEQEEEEEREGEGEGKQGEQEQPVAPIGNEMTSRVLAPGSPLSLSSGESFYKLRDTLFSSLDARSNDRSKSCACENEAADKDGSREEEVYSSSKESHKSNEKEAGEEDSKGEV